MHCTSYAHALSRPLVASVIVSLNPSACGPPTICHESVSANLSQHPHCRHHWLTLVLQSTAFPATRTARPPPLAQTTPQRPHPYDYIPAPRGTPPAPEAHVRPARARTPRHCGQQQRHGHGQRRRRCASGWAVARCALRFEEGAHAVALADEAWLDAACALGVRQLGSDAVQLLLLSGTHVLPSGSDGPASLVERQVHPVLRDQVVGAAHARLGLADARPFPPPERSAAALAPTVAARPVRHLRRRVAVKKRREPGEQRQQ